MRQTRPAAFGLPPTQPASGPGWFFPLVPVADHPETLGTLHHLAAEAAQVAVEFRAMGLSTLPPEAQDALSNLMGRLSALPRCSEDLCFAACAAAFFVATVVDPTVGLDHRLPATLTGPLSALQDRLLSLGQ